MKPNIAKLMIILATLFLCGETASAFYDPGLQRWINRDPIEEHGGITIFRFVDNNPINALDQFGECPLANPANAEAYAGKLGSSAGVSAGQAIGFMAGSIAANAIAATGLGLTLEALGPPVLGWFGLGGAAAESPQGQQAIQRTQQLINSLLQESKTLQRALWEDRVAVNNARNLIAKYRNMGAEPNQYGLMQDLKSFEEGVVAKEKAIQAISEQLSKLGCQSH